MKKEDEITLFFYGIEGITAYIRLYVHCRVSCDEPDVKCEYDKKS